MMIQNSYLIYSKLFLVRRAARSGFDYLYIFSVVRNLMLRLSRGERKVWRVNWLVVPFIIKGTFSKKFYLKVKNSLGFSPSTQHGAIISLLRHLNFVFLTPYRGINSLKLERSSWLLCVNLGLVLRLQRLLSAVYQHVLNFVCTHWFIYKKIKIYDRF